MSQIEQLERRITAALDRIGQGLEGLGANAGDAGEAEALRQELEDEKLATAQLEERIRTLKDKQASELAALKEASESQGEAVRRLDAELQALRRANQQLRENNQALRDANAAGVAEPHLINKSMLAELESLRANRATDIAELDAVMGRLDTLIAQAGLEDDAAEETTPEAEDL